MVNTVAKVLDVFYPVFTWSTDTSEPGRYLIIFDRKLMAKVNFSPSSTRLKSVPGMCLPICWGEAKR